MKRSLHVLTLLTVITCCIFGDAASKTVKFCPPKACLYYAGDFDSGGSDANAVFNADNEGSELVGQLWVGVKPDRDGIVTGTTFNQLMFGEWNGTNPIPFAIQTGIKPGHSGTTVCSTSGNATVKAYQEFDWGIVSSFTIKKLSKPCNLKKGTTYYVNLLPTYGDGYGAVVDVEDASPPNHQGWKTVIDNSYFNGSDFGANYQPSWGSNGACGGVGCDAFSIALTGTKTK
jgi:hypothetical protein